MSPFLYIAYTSHITYIVYILNTSHIVKLTKRYSSLQSGYNAMDDDCWKSTAVVDRDMMEETVERAQYIEFDEGTILL